MKRILFICFTLALTVACTTSTYSEELITKKDIAGLEKTIHSRLPKSKEITVYYKPKDTITVTGGFSITSKGNGCLEMGGLGIRLYDAHLDGVIFADGYLLKNEAMDIDGDGYRELVLTGEVILTDLDTNAFISKKPVNSVFKYDPLRQRLYQTVVSEYVYVYELKRSKD